MAGKLAGKLAGEFFTQAQISPQFRSGLKVDDAIQRIRNGTLDFTVFPLMECVRKDGKTYSLSNRRLYVARVLHIMGVLAEVQIDLLPFEHARVHRVKDGKTKWERVFSTRNMGVSVLVKSQYKHLLTTSLPTAAS